MRSRGPLLMLLCLLASLLVQGIASASTAAGAETRVWAFDLADGVGVGLDASLTLELRPGCELAYDDLASDSLLAARGGARAIDPNKLHHIFGDASHNLGPLVQKLGSQEATFTAVEGAAQAAVRSQGLTGLFETTVSVAGQNVVVRGNVMEGVARIGTFFIP